MSKGVDSITVKLKWSKISCQHRLDGFVGYGDATRVRRRWPCSNSPPLRKGTLPINDSIPAVTSRESGLLSPAKNRFLSRLSWKLSVSRRFCL